MTDKLISDILTQAVCEQIAHENYNANLYMYICGYLRNKGLDKLAAHFSGQRDEELEHAKDFFDFLTDLNGNVTMAMVPEVELNISTFQDIAKAYLAREILTTKSISYLRDLAVEEKNPVADEFFRKMISLQQKELAEASSMSDKADLLPEWWQVALWDRA